MKKTAGNNSLNQYVRSNKLHLMTKWSHYFEIYHKYFEKFRGKKVTILEIGVAQGGSLQMWKYYFGKNAKIIGVDIDQQCKELEEKQITIHIGNQQNRNFLKNLIAKTGPFDIVIDDGGHFMKQQIITFEELFPAVKNGGIFITEDIHSSYEKDFDGGYKKKGTFVEFVKSLFDEMHAEYFKDTHFKPTQLTQSLKAIHLYTNMVVFEKDFVKESRSEKFGIPVFISKPISKNMKYHVIKLMKFLLNIKTIYFSYMPSD